MRPLRIEKLRAAAFRNLERFTIEPGPAFNVLAGDNGAGKSSVLEAIHYLGALRSFRSAKTSDLVTLGRDAALLEARVAGGPAPRTFRVELPRAGPRRLALDAKRPRSIASWHVSLPMVIFHPGHLELVSGPAEGRRAFLDRALEQMDPTYASALGTYQKALRSRNRLLRGRGADRRAIAAFDEILASSGAVIGLARARLSADLGPRVEQAFADIVGSALPLGVSYRPRVEPSVDALRVALARSLDQDLARGYTSKGPHADDLGLELVGRAPARHHASQGQHRALVLALKVAELDVLGRRTGHVPILLLDDVSSELDRTRNRRLFDLLARLGGQVFLTTTQPELILLDRDRVDLRLEAGRVVSQPLPSPRP